MCVIVYIIRIFLLETHLPCNSLILEVARFSGSLCVTVMQSQLRQHYWCKGFLSWLHILTFSSSQEHAKRVGHVVNKKYFQQIFSVMFFLIFFLIWTPFLNLSETVCSIQFLWTESRYVSSQLSSLLFVREDCKKN